MRRSCMIGIIVGNSILLAVGISLAGISIFKYHNNWPLLTIFVHTLAILFPTICGQCRTDDDDDLFGFSSSSDEWVNPLTHVPWVLFGILVIVGYAVPVELFRARQLDVTAVWLTVSGGTLILSSVLIYVRVIYFTQRE